MRPYYQFGVVFLGLCLLSMTACIDSESPLSDPEKATPAKELLGVWRARQDDGTRYYHVGLASEKFSGLMQMKIIDHAKDGSLGVIEETFFLFPTALGDRHFVNITVLEPRQLEEAVKTGWKPAMSKGYWIYEYKQDGDKIRLLSMDWDQKKLLIESKKLKGVIKDDQVSFQENSETLAKFITSPDAAKLFQPREEVLERVK